MRTVENVNVTVAPGPDGTVRLLAPGVGYWFDLPRSGDLLAPAQTLGYLEQLGRRVRLTLPPGVQGQVRGFDPSNRRIAVSFGDELLVLHPPEGESAFQVDAAGGESLDSGQAAVRSPTDGVFYRRPSPDAPAFVEAGQRVRGGQPVGLVEVMKTFNQVRYGGDDLPDEAEVVEIRADDGQEVSAGEVLIVVKG